MRTPGTTVSAIGHLGLIGWLILGWGFDAEPLDFSDVSISVISGEEFDQAQAASTPNPGDADPTTPTPPEVDVTPPPAPATQEPPDPTPLPDPVEPPDEEAPPPPPPPVPPVADVADAPPTELTTPAAPPPLPDIEVTDDTPTQQQADRVASELIAPADPDTQTDVVAQEEVVPDDTSTADLEVEPQSETAPEPTATEIVIEDEAPSGAVDISLRPVSRPSRPQPPAPDPETDVAEAQEPVEPTEPDASAADAAAEAVAAAVAEATAESVAEAPAADPGPPMTGAERDSFRIAVNRCWNVDPGSVAARVTVEVGFSLDREGKVQGDVRLISSDGDQSAVNTAFEAARRAILRCQSSGYQLPAEKYEQWKEHVIVFDPSGMRLR